MTVLALASIKGSPGVTTTAIALTGVWPRSAEWVQPATLLECDPAGGDIAAALDLCPVPGLITLAASVRHAASTDAMWQHMQELPGQRGRVVPAAVGSAQAQAASRSLVESGLLRELARERGGIVIADCGRLDSGSPGWAIVGQATQALLVVRPCAAELAHLSKQLPELRESAPSLGLVLVGRAEFPAREITATLRVPVLGEVPHDPRGARIVLRSGLARRGSARLPLVRACRSLADQLAGQLERGFADGGASPAPVAAMAAVPPKGWLVGRPLSPDQPASANGSAEPRQEGVAPS